MRAIWVLAALGLAGCTQATNNSSTLGGLPAEAIYSLDVRNSVATVTFKQGGLACVGTANTRGIGLGESRPMAFACNDGRTGAGTYTVTKIAMNEVTFTLEDGTVGQSTIGA